MIEIQIHPSDIRRKVRYFFIGRRAVRSATVLLGGLLIFGVASMAAAPTVMRRVYKTNYLHSMRAEHRVQRSLLADNVRKMDSVQKELEVRRVKVEKLLAIYNLDKE